MTDQLPPNFDKLPLFLQSGCTCYRHIKYKARCPDNNLINNISLDKVKKYQLRQSLKFLLSFVITFCVNIKADDLCLQICLSSIDLRFILIPGKATQLLALVIHVRFTLVVKYPSSKQYRVDIGTSSKNHLLAALICLLDNDEH